MDVKRTWNTAEKPFQIIVRYDSAPGNNVWIGFGLILSFPPSPSKNELKQRRRRRQRGQEKAIRHLHISTLFAPQNFV